MAENDVKIIKYTISRLLAGREHSKHELLKKFLQRDFERHLCLEWVDKFCQHNQQSFYIIVVLAMNKFAMQLNRREIKSRQY